MKVLPNLTGLRFILAFLVMIYHIPQFCMKRGFPYFNDFPVFHKGQEAVYMFFSLSGFLIIGKLYSEKLSTDTINLKAFFVKRALRIFPLYYLILTFGFLYYWIILPYFGFSYENNYDLTKGLILSYTFFPNIFATYNPGGIIEILWSIGIEEQFYLIIAPLFFAIPFKYITRFLVIFTVLYFLLYFSEATSFFKSYRMLFFYFSTSGIFAILFLSNKINFYRFKYLIIITVILYFTTNLIVDNLTDSLYYFSSMILFALLISCLAQKPIKFLDNKVLIYLGKISYGIYMFHAIAMQIVGLLYLKTNFHLKVSSSSAKIIFYGLVIALTISIAAVSYKYFETYFLRQKRRFKT